MGQEILEHISVEAIKRISLILLLCGIGLPSFGQSPANLLSDVVPSHGFTTTLDIERTFNNARRQEEIQLGLPTNAISNLNLPSDAVWDIMSEEAKMLYLLNDERTARTNINYGSGPVKGLPFTAVVQEVDDVSNAYAQSLFINDAFTHTLNGTSPSSRLGGAISNACTEFTSRSENLYVSVSTANTGFPRTVERAVYGFNYDDASSAWGHREMNLLQDLDLQGRPWGFTNNEGSPASEGYIGVGVYRGTNYGGFGSNWPFGVMLVLNYIDPSTICTFTILEGESSLAPDPCDDPVILTSISDSDVISSDESITLTSGASFEMATTISSQEINILRGFSVDVGTCIQMINDGCDYNGTFTCATDETDESDQNDISGSGSCSSPFIFTCNLSHEGSNIGRPNIWSSYGTTSNWTGGEVTYEISLTPGERRMITLSNLTADLDLFLATRCSSDAVALSSTSVGTTSESLTFSSSSGGTFYIIIDGWAGAQSNFVIDMTCSSQLSAREVSAKSYIVIQKEKEMQMVGDPYVRRPRS